MARRRQQSAHWLTCDEQWGGKLTHHAQRDVIAAFVAKYRMSCGRTAARPLPRSRTRTMRSARAGFAPRRFTQRRAGRRAGSAWRRGSMRGADPWLWSMSRPASPTRTRTVPTASEATSSGPACRKVEPGPAQRGAARMFLSPLRARGTARPDRGGDRDAAGGRGRPRPKRASPPSRCRARGRDRRSDPRDPRCRSTAARGRPPPRRPSAGRR